MSRNPVCRRCRKHPATVNAWCDVCWAQLHPSRPEGSKVVEQVKGEDE